MKLPLRLKRVCLLTSGILLAYPPAAFPAQFAYVTNSGDNTVSVIDTASNVVIATVPVGPSPFGVAISPTNSRAYVSNFGDGVHPGNVSVIDQLTNEVIATVPVDLTPRGVALDDRGHRLYVAEDGGAVAVIDTIGNTLVARIAVGDSPFGLALAVGGNPLYVANASDSTERPPCVTSPATFCDVPVSVVDTATNSELRRLTVSAARNGSPSGIAVNPLGTRLYVGNAALVQGTFFTAVSALDIADGPAGGYIGTIPVARDDSYANIVGLALNESGTTLYAATPPTSELSVIDTVTGAVTTKVLVGRRPSGVSITPDGGHVYVANRDSDNVSVLDTTTLQVVSTVPVGRSPVAFGSFIADVALLTPRPTPTPGFSCGDVCTPGQYCRVDFSGSVVVGACSRDCRCLVEDSTPTPTPMSTCVGDCSADKMVTIDEIITCVNIALGTQALDACLACAASPDAGVTIPDIITAVNNALNGCLNPS